MNHYVHNLNPVILDLGQIQIRWYGLMYVIGFIIAGFLLKILVKKKFFKVSLDKIDSLITTMIICMFLGARFLFITWIIILIICWSFWPYGREA